MAREGAKNNVSIKFEERMSAAMSWLSGWVFLLIESVVYWGTNVDVASIPTSLQASPVRGLLSEHDRARMHHVNDNSRTQSRLSLRGKKAYLIRLRSSRSRFDGASLMSMTENDVLP